VCTHPTIPLLSPKLINRLVAKKLKRDWVTKQKTKSKWKAQKHREGIVTQRDALSRSGTLGDPLATPQSAVVREERSTRADEAEIDEETDGLHNSSGDEPAPMAPVQKDKQKMRRQEEGVANAGPSLRELQRQAYSPAALHHHKSHPLHHSKGRIGTHDARIHGSSQKKASVRDTRSRGQRGGQPDMRLRMSAMLEKIKRDYS
jgi:hypothetical protein